MISAAKKVSLYDTFDLLREATKLKLIEDTDYCLVYHKMVQTGELELRDYGWGFLNFELTAHACSRLPHVFPAAATDDWVISVRIATVDDGSMGGWSKPTKKPWCRNATHLIAHDVLKDMVRFPTLEALNERLRGFGIWVDHE